MEKMEIIRANPRTRIHIGSTGEKSVTKVVFDISDWYKTYGYGDGKDNSDIIINLIIEQNSKVYFQPDEYLIKEFKEDNQKLEVHWEITGDNTQTPGVGKCELVYMAPKLKDDGTQENLLKKSAIYEFVVTDSLGGESGDPPKYVETWWKRVLEAAGNINDVSEEAEQAKEAKEAAEAAATRAETFTTKPPMPYGGVWHIWNSETETYETTSEPAVLTIVKSYSSIEEMEVDKLNMKENDLVIIASESIEDEDNSKLYILSNGNWKFLSDLSGTGSGIGDMKVDVYDPQGKATDIFDYIDKKVDNISSVVLRKWTTVDFEEVEGE